MNTATAKRAKLLFFIVKCADLWRCCHRHSLSCLRFLIWSSWGRWRFSKVDRQKRYLQVKWFLFKKIMPGINVSFMHHVVICLTTGTYCLHQVIYRRAGWGKHFFNFTLAFSLKPLFNKAAAVWKGRFLLKIWHKTSNWNSLNFTHLHRLLKVTLRERCTLSPSDVASGGGDGKRKSQWSTSCWKRTCN